MRHLCIDCGKPDLQGFHPFCAACGGMVDVEYDLKQVQLQDSTNPYVRFADLLPVTDLRARLPDTTYSPVIHASRLGRSIGMRSLYLKDETALPTRSTKDRMAAVSLPYLHSRGVRCFCASSTGNSSTAFSHGIRAFPDMHLFLFTGESFVPRVQYADHPQVTHFGLRHASFVEASEVANRYAVRHGLIAEGGFFNPGRREGLKLAFMEASEQVPRPIDWYVQAVSSAMGVYGTFKGARELLQLKRLTRLPRLLCVQQETCAPMVRAFAEGSESIRPEHRVAMPTGIAEAILRGDPTRAFPRVRRIVNESRGGFVAVTEAQIRTARRKAEDLEGVSPCFSAAAALAGLLKLAEEGELAADAVVLVNITGGDREGTASAEHVEWIDKTADGWNVRPPAAGSYGMQGKGANT